MLMVAVVSVPRYILVGRSLPGRAGCQASEPAGSWVGSCCPEGLTATLRLLIYLTTARRRAESVIRDSLLVGGGRRDVRSGQDLVRAPIGQRKQVDISEQFNSEMNEKNVMWHLSTGVARSCAVADEVVRETTLDARLATPGIRVFMALLEGQSNTFLRLNPQARLALRPRDCGVLVKGVGDQTPRMGCSGLRRTELKGVRRQRKEPLAVRRLVFPSPTGRRGVGGSPENLISTARPWRRAMAQLEVGRLGSCCGLKPQQQGARQGGGRCDRTERNTREYMR